MCYSFFVYIKSIATFCSDPISEVKIEFGKNALAISGAVSNLAQHPHQHQERKGSRWGEGKTNHAIKSEMSDKPALKAQGPKTLLSMSSSHNFQYFISCSILGRICVACIENMLL